MDRDFLNLRPLEIMACGGFLISDRIPCLEREFNGGAVFTGGGSDPVEKISTYLEDEEARKRITHYRMELVHEWHSIRNRSKAVHEYLNGP